jgi:hypothetical protein
MATSAQALILPGAYAAPYTAGGTIGVGCAVGFPDANGEVAVVTTVAPIMGIAANAVVTGEEVFVVGFGPAYAKLTGAVTWATSPFLVPDAAGEFVAAATNETSQVRAFPDAREGAAGESSDLIRVVVGVGAFHS